MAIWFEQPNLTAINKLHQDTAISHLDIQFIAFGDDYLKAQMPVDSRHHQPFGLLHGGVSVVLSETLGSTGAYLTVDPKLNNCVGIEVNANHVRPVKKGFITGICRPFHLGNTLQVWETKIFNEKDQLICVSRLTVAILSKKL